MHSGCGSDKSPNIVGGYTSNLKSTAAMTTKSMDKNNTMGAKSRYGETSILSSVTVNGPTGYATNASFVGDDCMEDLHYGFVQFF